MARSALKVLTAGLFLALSFGVLSCGGFRVGRGNVFPQAADRPFPAAAFGPKTGLFFMVENPRGVFWLCAAEFSGRAPRILWGRPVFPEPAKPSPRGDAVLFSALLRPDRRDLFLLRAGAREAERLSVGAVDHAPGGFDWSSDGEEVLYVGDRKGFEGVYRHNLRAGTRRLEFRPAPYQKAETPRYLGSGRDFIVVLREKDRAELWRSRGDRLYRLSPAAPGEFYRNPRPSPDGTWLIVETNRFGGLRLARVETENGDIRPFGGRLSLEGRFWNARVSPGGKWVLFCSDWEGTPALYRTEGSGEMLYRLTPAWLNVQEAVWHPGEERIFFTAVDQEGRTALYETPAGGGAVREISDVPLNVFFLEAAGAEE